MHAFVLGVPGRYRGTALEGDLVAQGIPFDVIPGADARTWTANDLARLYSARAAQVVCHRQLAATEVACAVGHQKMIEALLELGDQWAMLLEDDARILQPLAPLLAALHQLPDAPIVVQLGGYGASMPHEEPVEFDGGRLWRQPRPVFGAHAYLMNRRAALTAERAYRNRRVDSPADWPFCWWRAVQFWRPDAKLAQQQGEISLIRADRMAHRAAGGQARGLLSEVGMGLLQLIGVSAAYGRAQGLPFRWLYRRDVVEGRRRLRRRLAPPRPHRAEGRT